MVRVHARGRAFAPRGALDARPRRGCLVACHSIIKSVGPISPSPVTAPQRTHSEPQKIDRQDYTIATVNHISIISPEHIGPGSTLKKGAHARCTPHTPREHADRAAAQRMLLAEADRRQGGRSLNPAAAWRSGAAARSPRSRKARPPPTSRPRLPSRRQIVRHLAACRRAATAARSAALL